MAEELGYSKVIDFGCGHGRLCESFHPEGYLGIDIDQKALDTARSRFQNYQFSLANEIPRFADIYLAHSVFNQFSDKALHETLKLIRCKWLILAESLNMQWKSAKAVPIYSRDLDEYVRIMRAHDLVLHKSISQQSSLAENVTYMVFRKCLKNPLV